MAYGVKQSGVVAGGDIGARITGLVGLGEEQGEWSFSYSNIFYPNFTASSGGLYFTEECLEEWVEQFSDIAGLFKYNKAPLLSVLRFIQSWLPQSIWLNKLGFVQLWKVCSAHSGECVAQSHSYCLQITMTFSLKNMPCTTSSSCLSNDEENPCLWTSLKKKKSPFCNLNKFVKKRFHNFSHQQL